MHVQTKRSSVPQEKSSRGTAGATSTTHPSISITILLPEYDTGGTAPAGCSSEQPRAPPQPAQISFPPRAPPQPAQISFPPRAPPQPAQISFPRSSSTPTEARGTFREICVASTERPGDLEGGDAREGVEFPEGVEPPEGVESPEGIESPDGGWGWTVVAASFVAHVIADGCGFSFGVLFGELLEVFGESTGRTAWVGSLFVSVPAICGPVASALTNRYGCRWTTILGGLVAGAGCFLSAYTTSIGQLCVTFGLVAGFGLSLVFVPTVVIVAFYFEKRRAFATGIAVAGSGIGTMIFAPLTEWLIEQYQWRGALTITSGILLNIVVCGALFRPLDRAPVHNKASFSCLSNSRKESKGDLASCLCSNNKGVNGNLCNSTECRAKQPANSISLPISEIAASRSCVPYNLSSSHMEQEHRSASASSLAIERRGTDAIWLGDVNSNPFFAKLSVSTTNNIASGSSCVKEYVHDYAVPVLTVKSGLSVRGRQQISTSLQSLSGASVRRGALLQRGRPEYGSTTQWPASVCQQHGSVPLQHRNPTERLIDLQFISDLNRAGGNHKLEMKDENDSMNINNDGCSKTGVNKSVVATRKGSQFHIRCHSEYQLTSTLFDYDLRGKAVQTSLNCAGKKAVVPVAEKEFIETKSEVGSILLSEDLINDDADERDSSVSGGENRTINALPVSGCADEGAEIADMSDMLRFKVRHTNSLALGEHTILNADNPVILTSDAAGLSIACTTSHAIAANAKSRASTLNPVCHLYLLSPASRDVFQFSVSGGRRYSDRGPMYLRREDIVHRGSLLKAGFFLSALGAARSASCPDIMATSEPVGVTWRQRVRSFAARLLRVAKHALRAAAQLVDVSMFGSALFVYFCVHSVLLYVSYDIPYVYGPVRATAQGISDSSASLLVSIIGFFSTVGQVLMGYLGDQSYVSVLTFYNTMTTVAGLVTLLMPQARSFEALAAMCAAYGFFISANFALTTVILVDLLGVERLTNAFGIVSLAQGVANLVGPPLAGWISDETASFDAAFYTAGCVICLSGCMLFAAPCLARCEGIRLSLPRVTQCSTSSNTVSCTERLARLPVVQTSSVNC